MQLTVRRSPERFKRTSWRPASSSIEQVEVVEYVRRIVPTTQPDKIVHRPKVTVLRALDLLLAGAGSDYTDARIEDTYKPGKFVDGFVYIHALGAFVHKSEVAKIESQHEKISAGCIVAEGARIIGDSHIGANTELERSVIIADSTIGDKSIVRKGSRVERSAIGGLSYVGQFMYVKDSRVGSMYKGDRNVVLGRNTEVGRQNQHGANSVIKHDAWLDDSVRIGANSFIGAGAQIGEMFHAGVQLHVGEGAVVGAESRFGSFVRVGRNVILASPTFAEDGALLMQTIIGVRPENRN